MIPAILLYADDIQSFRDLITPEEMGLCILSAADFAMTGQRDERGLSAAAKGFLRVLCAKIGRDQDAYQKRITGGVKGGRPRKNLEKPPENMVSDEKPSENMVFSKKPSENMVSNGLETVSETVSKTVSETVPVSVSVSESVSERQAGKVPPTLEEVRRYAETTKTTIDPERFFSYYQSRGWELSPGMPMRNWQAVFNIWIQNEAEKGQAKKKTVTAQQFPQRTYSDSDMSSFYTDLSAYARPEEE